MYSYLIADGGLLPGSFNCTKLYLNQKAPPCTAGKFKLAVFTVPTNHDHINTNGHDLSLENFSIVGREDHSIARSIKEAILIRVNDPSLNRNIGKYQLLHIWDDVLVKSPELELRSGDHPDSPHAYIKS